MRCKDSRRKRLFFCLGLTRNQDPIDENAEKIAVSENLETNRRQTDSAVSGLDPDLLAIAQKWASLPAAVRAGIVAMVNAASDYV